MLLIERLNAESRGRPVGIGAYRSRAIKLAIVQCDMAEQRAASSFSSEFRRAW
jgi:hypothetical protein